MLPDIEELYEPYSKDADLNTTLLYWGREAKKLGISPDIREAAIAETFLELANGKVFPIGTCDCGCDFPVEWSCVALNHYTLRKMISIRDKISAKVVELMKEDIHAGMLAIIESRNAEFVKEQMQETEIQGINWVFGHSPL